MLTGIGFLAVYTARQQEISSTSLVYAGFFLALYAIAHIGLRAGLPDADPWLLPLAALLTRDRPDRDLPPHARRWPATSRCGSWSGWPGSWR